MAEDPPDKRTWSDSQLIATVAVSHSWRGVMRELGLCATSAGAIRFVKRHVILLGLDTSHFTGQRRWSDAQLKRSVADAYSWRELLSELGLGGSAAERTRVKAHATRLGLDLSRMQPPGGDRVPPGLKPEINRLQPAVYDLLVSMPLHAWTELSEFRSRPQHTKRTAGRSKWADVPTPWGIAACWGFRATRTRSGAAQPGTAPQTPPAEPARSRVLHRPPARRPAPEIASGGWH